MNLCQCQKTRPVSGETVKGGQKVRNVVNSVVVNCKRAASKERHNSGCCKTSVIKICEQCFLCRSIVFCQTCTKCPKCCTNSACMGQTEPFWETQEASRARPKVLQILKEGYTLPFQTRPNMTRSPTIKSCYVNPHRNLYLMEALHQFMNKNA